MEKTPHYDSYVKILEEELIPAMGCTEPIAIALAAAKARETLGSMPLACRVEVSGNIIKNVKAVTVPNTGGLKGIEAAAAAGIVAGKAELELEVMRSLDIVEMDIRQTPGNEHFRIDQCISYLKVGFGFSDAGKREYVFDRAMGYQ